MSRSRNISRLLPSNSGQLTNNAMCSGSVIQTVQYVLGNEFGTSAKTSVATGLAATITPTKVTNKILVRIVANVRSVGPGSGNAFTILHLNRDSTVIYDAAFQSGNFSSSDIRTPGVIEYLDSPNTISSITYQLYIDSTYSTASYINANAGFSSITLMEIAQ